VAVRREIPAVRALMLCCVTATAATAAEVLANRSVSLVLVTLLSAESITLPGEITPLGAPTMKPSAMFVLLLVVPPSMISPNSRVAACKGNMGGEVGP
jgi:hypothetical protein